MALTNPAATVLSVQARGALARSDQRSDDRRWLAALRSTGPEREQATAQLHALLVRAARFELLRRRTALNGRADAIEDLAVQSADTALVSILRKLDGYRFESRFTTWAYKFAILEAAVTARGRAWQERELPVDPQAWTTLPDQSLGVVEELAERRLLRQVLAAIQTELSPHQREVLTALVFAEVPIDVLAERMNTTRGALYKTLHDARRKLRAHIQTDDHD